MNRVTKILRMTLKPKMKAGEGGMGGRHQENFEGDEGQVEEDEITDEGREDCGKGVEDRNLGNIRRRRSSQGGAAVKVAMEGDLMVED